MKLVKRMKCEPELVKEAGSAVVLVQQAEPELELVKEVELELNLQIQNQSLRTENDN